MKRTSCQLASHPIISSTILGKRGGLSLDFATSTADLTSDLSKLSCSSSMVAADSRDMIGTATGVSPRWHFE
jgi:hypothetical protein